MFIAGGAIPVLYIAYVGDPPHGQARDARGARGHPLHRDRRAGGRAEDERRGGRGGEDDVSAGGPARRRLRRFLLARRRRCSSGSRPTRTGARCAIAPPASVRRAHDDWQCPEGQHLWPHEFDHERRLVRYRAKAHICNGCPRKERLHGLRPRPRDRAAARPVAALRGRPLPPRASSLMLVALALLVLAVGVRPQPRARPRPPCSPA